MSFWKSLFGGGGSGSVAAVPKTLKEVEHNGFTIAAQPYAAEGQFQVAGLISKSIDGTRKEHRFVRADRFSTPDDAADVAIAKGRQIIDQQGDKLFH